MCEIFYARLWLRLRARSGLARLLLAREKNKVRRNGMAGPGIVIPMKKTRPAVVAFWALTRRMTGVGGRAIAVRLMAQG
jgi:hypothetical protein